MTSCTVQPGHPLSFGQTESSASRQSARSAFGTGSALLATVESITRERGGRLIEIAVDGADIDARRFYERHGYTDTGTGQDQPSFYYCREIP